MWENAFASLTLVHTPACILELRVLKEHPTWDEWRELQGAIRTFYAKAGTKGLRACLLFDLTKLGLLNPAMVQELIGLFKELREETARIVYCSAMVITAPFIRDALNFFLQSYDAVRPIYVCGTVADATSKCADWVAANATNAK